MEHTPVKKAAKNSAFLLPTILTILIVVAFFLTIAYFLFPSNNPVPAAASTGLDTLEQINQGPSPAEMVRMELMKEVRRDSTQAIASARDFFQANQEKDKSLLEATLSDSIYKYPVLKFTNKGELVHEIEKYWYLVTDEKNIMDPNSIYFYSEKIDSSLRHSYAVFDIHYTAQAKQGPLDLDFAVNMEFDDQFRVIGYATERK